ncbi:LysE family translocator [Kocuria sp. CCUG 69068]|uniref:Amino acid transporter n=1 Tax=Kocuria rosea subsp. polaris TaxID=136273 RepID=A0A0A6VV01_KOCRO|nr:LysE family translocator [Kocuria polaris]KHD98023.1 amino acid transporter [Kocuria polaris]MCC5784283.1 LysE family translocator [Kocuria sp. CCUG 69068]MCM3484249.1 LysE family translocator [Kocuria rosea]
MEASQYLALLGLWIAGIVAPGPDVLVILRNASLGSRAAGVLTAVGVMTGNLVWITLSLTGVTVLIGQADTLQRLIQVAGALFLGWLGVSGIRAGLVARAVPDRVPSAAGGGPGSVPGEPQAPPGRSVTPGRAFVLGLVTNLSNAKAIIFFVALFANVVPVGALWWEAALVFALLVAVGLAWFTAVAWVGSVERLAAGFRRHGAAVELAAGVLFLVLALGLLLSAL